MATVESLYSKLPLLDFYAKHKESYWQSRLKKDTWGESYKWEIFPKLNSELEKYQDITQENVSEVVNILLSNIPSEGPFVNWRELDHLSSVLENANGFQVFKHVWSKPDDTEQSINSANSVAEFYIGTAFSPRFYAYILAAQDCNSYCIYLDDLYKRVADLLSIEKPGSLNRGQKYKLVQQACVDIGVRMVKDGLRDSSKPFIALNGQDFLYKTLK